MRLAGIFCTVLGVALAAFTLSRLVAALWRSTAGESDALGAVVCPALAGLGLGIALLLGGSLLLWKAAGGATPPSDD